MSASSITSGVFYNWENEIDRGYKTEFYDKTATVKLKYMDYSFMPTQIINLKGESVVILNSIEVQRNAYHTSPSAGRIEN